MLVYELLLRISQVPTWCDATTACSQSFKLEDRSPADQRAERRLPGRADALPGCHQEQWQASSDGRRSIPGAHIHLPLHALTVCIGGVLKPAAVGICYLVRICC